MIRSCILATAVALLSSTASFAADLAPSELRPGFSWGGIYAGASAGYVWNKGTDTFGTTSDNLAVNAATVSGFVGYNYEISPAIIAGLEGELGYDWNKVTTASGTKATGGLDTTLRGRIGLSYDRALLYVAGGYAGTALKLERGTTSTTPWLNGWTIGAGVDYAIADNLFLRGEYRYAQYAKQNVTLAGATHTVDLWNQTFKVGLGMKF